MTTQEDKTSGWEDPAMPGWDDAGANLSDSDGHENASWESDVEDAEAVHSSLPQLVLETILYRQVFRLVAPRAERYLSWGGNLREMLFDGSARVIVDLLAVPIRPQIPAGPMDSPSAKDTPVGEASKAVHEVSGVNHPVTILHLPTELLLLIFDQLESIEDVVCFGLARRSFWALAQGYLHGHYQSLLGPWAGENIMCAGDYSERGDYPPGLFFEEELKELSDWTYDRPGFEDGAPYTIIEYIALVDFADPYVSIRQNVVDFKGKSLLSLRQNLVDLKEESLRLLSRCMKRSQHDDPAFVAARSEPAITESIFFPQEEPWILRNLTTREFVRAEAIALRPEYIHGPHISVLGFGEVVLSRVCWSTGDNTGVNADISRGVWAGHCFDITTLARHQATTPAAEWTDVSDEVAREITDIWRSEFGADAEDLRRDLVRWYPRRPNTDSQDLTPPIA